MIFKFFMAFVLGGALCVIAQILMDKTGLTPARILVIYVVVGVVLGAVGLYEPLLELAGGGASTPLTGFGYLIARGVREAVDGTGLLGVLTGGFTAASGGICAAVVLALLSAAIFKNRPRR